MRRAGGERIRARGVFRMRVYRHGRLWAAVREPNLVVDAGLTLIAQRIAGNSASANVSKIGFGTDGTAAAAGDTSLTGGVTRAITSVSYPSAGQAQFNWTLPENEGNGLSIREFGLLAGATNILVARKVRAALEKTNAISLVGSWTLDFS